MFIRSNHIYVISNYNVQLLANATLKTQVFEQNIILEALLTLLWKYQNFELSNVYVSYGSHTICSAKVVIVEVIGL